MTIHKVSYIALTFLFFLVSCRKEEVVNCDEAQIRGIGISLDDYHFIPSKCAMQIIYPDSIFEFESTYIAFNQGTPYISLKFDEDVEKKLSPKANYNIILDDSLHFYVEDITLKADTFGMTGMGKWSFDCVIDSLTINGVRIDPKSNRILDLPISLMKSYKE